MDKFHERKTQNCASEETERLAEPNRCFEGPLDSFFVTAVLTSFGESPVREIRTPGLCGGRRLALRCASSDPTPMARNLAEKVGNRCPRDPPKGRRSWTSCSVGGNRGETLSSQTLSLNPKRVYIRLLLSAVCAGSIGMSEEPDERIVHVRICGGDGEVTPRLYPELRCPTRLPIRKQIGCFHVQFTNQPQPFRGCEVGKGPGICCWPKAHRGESATLSPKRSGRESSTHHKIRFSLFYD